ncbi:hypothetical protein CVT24_002266 [Panaeolus cyanescens]|uniref:F-box domain-containing protein n=1 Tax=Panaeolus cyanescens TaxID=181874 RepID=A0A409YIA6_9AGAR|nr:hypothetical protein CVT24_002266 [Panaeolus cyanescens]
MTYSRFLRVLKQVLFLSKPSKPVLPYEVWRTIYYLLPKEDRLELYSVNPALFNLAMDELYASLDLRDPVSAHTQRCVANLSRVVIKRVKSLALNLKPDVCDEIESELPSWSRPVYRTIYKLFFQDTFSKKVERLPTRIPRMKTLSSLIIDCTLHENVTYSRKRFQTFIKPGRTRWIGPSSLSKLDLKAPLDLVHRSLHSAPILQHLDELILTLNQNPTHDDQPLLSDVAKFVNEKCSSITKLGMHNACNAIDQFFTSLAPLPCLSCLSFVLPSHYTEVHEFTGCHSFLIAYADVLRTVTLGIDYDSDSDSGGPHAILHHPIFSISFPKLTSLILRPTISNSTPRLITSPSDWENPSEFAYMDNHTWFIISFLEKHSESFIQNLAQLQVPNLWPYENEIPEIVKPLFHNSFPLLEVLDIRFSELAKGNPPRVIRHPRPYDYDDVYFDWHNDKYNDIVSMFIPHFNDDLGKHDFSTWGLRRMHLEFITIDRGSEAPIYDPFREPLARAMPSLIWFNGEEIWRDADNFSTSR